ncbi:hypothetical protein GCK72_021035 [Caenorhabditis remanei]|uniref:F-box domain-containing protein n=1 Tax=Caenorhabditis remanei TaxID=31234 RepID=A0A6A5GIW7_CAERE|nr:hypothetical protein GCK72_021035 [Caenorhabditis remanei]KAF1754472.1 hypothetical protein GCK72_021035 [Caenorhabditis remanei]
MVTSLSDHPIDIRALNIYDNSQWKTPEKSYSNYKKLCEAFGTQSVSYEEYENWFNIHSKEAYYSKDSKRGLPLPDIRGCILSDVINGKTAEKSLNDLCEAFEEQKIDKEDHDYWYKRFKNGHLFTRVTFSDLPEDVIAEIIGKCELEAYLNLRNVSYGLRTIVNQKPPAFTEFYVFCEDGRMEINAGNAFFVSQNLFSYQIAEPEVLKMLKFLLNHTKLRLEFFSFEAVSNHYRHEMMTGGGDISEEWLFYKYRFIYFLDDELDHKIHVEECSISVQTEENFIGILEYLKPGTLETLELTNDPCGRRYDINDIVRMDQWKQAKHLRLYGFNLPSIKHLLHFTTIETEFEQFSMEDLVQLCNGLSKSNNFEWGTMETYDRLDTEAIKEALNLQETTSPEVYSIPNSNLVVELFLDTHTLSKMIELPLNSPNQFRSLILYHISQWKTIEKSYKNYEKLCEVKEKEAISYDNYEYWFNRYLKEAYYSAKDGRAHRVADLEVCIFADIIDGRSTENSYKDMCDASGNIEIDEGQHADWYTLLDMDVQQLACIRAEQPKKGLDATNNVNLSFSDFPEDVIAEIVDRCDLKSYLNLRNVSHSLRTIVDQRPPPCTDIFVFSGGDYFLIEVNKADFIDSFPIELNHSRYCSLDFIEKRVFRELEVLLKNPKLRLESFRFWSFPPVAHSVERIGWIAALRNYEKNFFELLNSINYKIHSQKCIINARNEEDTMRILKCFKSGTLKELEINERLSSNELVEMDQWKQAKHLKLLGTRSLPIENFSHFSTFQTTFETISVHDLVLLCDHLSKSTNFEACTIKTRESLDEDAIKEALNLQKSESSEKYSIPNSTIVVEFFHFTLLLKTSKNA